MEDQVVPDLDGVRAGKSMNLFVALSTRNPPAHSAPRLKTLQPKPLFSIIQLRISPVAQHEGLGATREWDVCPLWRLVVEPNQRFTSSSGYPEDPSGRL